MSGTTTAQAIATDVTANLADLRKMAPSVASWLEDVCPGVKVAEMVNTFPNLANAIGSDEAASTQLFHANTWIALAALANKGRTDKDVLTRSTAPSAMFALIMPHLTAELVEQIISANSGDEDKADINPETGNEVANGANADAAVLEGVTAPNPAELAKRVQNGANGTKSRATATK